MKTLKIELADQLASQVERAVASGSFKSSSEVIEAALKTFLDHRYYELAEEQQLAEIESVLREK
jgi:Arc/MetJ-type ribon-helix-helix transcriptional regulator